MDILLNTIRYWPANYLHCSLFATVCVYFVFYVSHYVHIECEGFSVWKIVDGATGEGEQSPKYHNGSIGQPK